jgi:hypothetical protein
MSTHVLAYISAAVTAALGLAAGGWPISTPGGLLVAAVAGLLSVLVVWVIVATRPARAAWHARRAADLGHASPPVSGVWGKVAGFVFGVVLLAQWAHELRASWLWSS